MGQSKRSGTYQESKDQQIHRNAYITLAKIHDTSRICDDLCHICVMIWQDLASASSASTNTLEIC